MALQLAQSGKRGAGPNLYDLLVDALKNKKSQVPPRIISEWTRSPVFLAWQEELNLLADETASSIKWIEQINKIFSDSKKTIGLPESTKDRLKNKIQGFVKEIPNYEKILISGINHELGFLNRYMIARWVGAYENSQFVEVEVYNTTGENLIQKNA